VVLTALAAGLSAVHGLSLLAYARLSTAIGAAVALALFLISGERERHERAEGELAAQASFLESLVESMRAIAGTTESRAILEQARAEAERLFGARARLLSAEEEASEPQGLRTMTIPLDAAADGVVALRLERDTVFPRGDAVRATVLADFAGRASENARLLLEAKVREAERSALSDQLITAEQEERRRLALYLHDTVVQSLSGIALMLDAGLGAVEEGRADEARSIIGGALDRHRTAIKALRDLSFNLEPVVLRDQGFASAVNALAEQLALANEIQIDVDVEAAESLTEQAQAALYQIIREALHQAIRRGPPTRIGVRVDRRADGATETVVSDDAPGERRRRSFEAIEERARTLNGRLDVEQGSDGGTAVRVVLPHYSVTRSE
jgi:signal transduction histidine kinase